MAENDENNALRLNGNNNINMLRIESPRNINEDESVMYNTELQSRTGTNLIDLNES